MNKWAKSGEPSHVILGGLDGDHTACQLMKEGYVDATGVQDLYTEATLTMDAIIAAIGAGEKTPNKWLQDPGFALTLGNLAQREMDMWGCKILAEKQTTAQ
jgi:ABC-type sugar transport system substrate-binding protein